MTCLLREWPALTPSGKRDRLWWIRSFFFEEVKMHRIATATLLVLFALSSGLAAADLGVTVEPKKTALTLGEKLSVVLTVENQGSRSLETAEAVNDIRSAFLEIGWKGRRFEFMRINPKFFDPILKGGDVKEYLKQVRIPPNGAETCTFELLLPAAGTYRIRGVYKGTGERVLSPWTEVTVSPKGDVEALRVKMKTNKGTMVFGFYDGEALGTVINFLLLVEQGFYDGLGFHRIIKDFMNQGGDPDGNGSGGPGYFIPQEFNDLPHEPGVLSMARIGKHVDTAGSQIFLCATMPVPTKRLLNRQYTVFGYTIEGLKVVEAINSVQTRRDNRPVRPVTMEKVEILSE